MHDPGDNASTEEGIVATLATAARVAVAIMVGVGLAHGAAQLLAAL